jgi:aldehyde dehydrogenase (NAD+)
MAGVFTQDINKALRFATDVDAGMVGINAISMAFLSAPFGGTKMSGLGRENAIDALRMYTDRKTVFINMVKQ